MMKTLAHRRSLFGMPLLFTALLVWTPGAIAQQQITFSGDPWPPYVNGELGTLADSGIAVEIVDRIFARIDGAEAVFPLIPWKRALLEVEQGHSDGIAMLLKTPERESYMEFSLPLLDGHNLLWYVDDGQGAFEWRDLDDLNGKRIGVVEDYSYGPEMDARFASGAVTAVRGPTVEHLFAMLSAGRLSLIMSNDAVGYAVLRELGDARIRAASRPLSSETFYIGLSKRSPARALMPQINAAILDLQDKGVIDRLVRGQAAD